MRRLEKRDGVGSWCIEVLSKGGHRVSLVGLPFRQGFCLDNLEKDGHGTPKGLGTNSFGC